MKKLYFIILIPIINLLLAFVSSDMPIDFEISIPTAGNSWVMTNDDYISSDLITEDGIQGWNNQDKVIRTFLYTESPAEISLAIRGRVDFGNSEIEITLNHQSKKITLTRSEYSNIIVGNFSLDKPGYYFIDMELLTSGSNPNVDVSDIFIDTENASVIKYIKDDFYFGRRGPSDHLKFEIPEGVVNVEWFYSEIMIPKNQDVVGSYFMANGFAEGYFGIQVNSLKERRILFSIWSPFKTDNPSEVPGEYKIKMLAKGENVTTGEFGSEGSGGQSYKVFNWKTGVNYGFLVGANPTEEGSTEYSAFFFDPEVKKWNLIAKFSRPKTSTYLKGLYSFLENFIPQQGVYERRGLYHNQWVYDSSGWHEITRATFTADNTARKEYRMDYSGGLEGSGFFLKNCGFSNAHTLIGTQLKRQEQSKKPDINFDQLK